MLMALADEHDYEVRLPCNMNGIQQPVLIGNEPVSQPVFAGDMTLRYDRYLPSSRIVQTGTDLSNVIPNVN